MHSNARVTLVLKMSYIHWVSLKSSSLIGYYQHTEKFTDSITGLVETNAESEGVMVKPGVMDIDSMVALTRVSKEKVKSCFNVSKLEANQSASRAALHRIVLLRLKV